MLLRALDNGEVRPEARPAPPAPTTTTSVSRCTGAENEGSYSGVAMMTPSEAETASIKAHLRGLRVLRVERRERTDLERLDLHPVREGSGDELHQGPVRRVRGVVADDADECHVCLLVPKGRVRTGPAAGGRAAGTSRCVTIGANREGDGLIQS